MRLAEEKIAIAQTITGIRGDHDLGYWVHACNNPKDSPVRAGVQEMDLVYFQAQSLRERMMTEEPAAIFYHLAFRSLQRAYETGEEEKFKGACEDYLAAVGGERVG